MSHSEPAAEPTAAKGGMGSKIKIGGFIVAIILVECVVAYMYIPSAEQIAALAQNKLVNQAQEAVTAALPESHDEHSKATVEVDLGEFSVTAFQPTTNTSLRIDFRLHGVVLEKEEEEFAEKLEKNTNRFREHVIIIIRGSEVTDLTDAGLGLIKRKILEKTSRLLGSHALQSVGFTDFSFVEQ